VSKSVDLPDPDVIESEDQDVSLDWSPWLYRAARWVQGLMLLALLLMVGLGFGSSGPFALIGRETHRGIVELEHLETKLSLPSAIVQTISIPTPGVYLMVPPFCHYYRSYPAVLKLSSGEMTSGG